MPRPPRNTNGAKRGGAIFNILVLILLVLIGVTAALGFAAYSAEMDSRAVSAMRTIVETDSIYDNIYINGVKVGGMSKSEATETLFDLYQRPANEKTIILTDGSDETYELPLSRFNANYDISSAVEAAYGYGRGASLEDRYDEVRRLLTRPYELTAEYTFDESLIVNALEFIARRLDTEPVNAGIIRQNRQFFTVTSQTGQRVDIEATLKNILPLVESIQGGTAKLVIETLYPEYTEENFLSAQSLIGTFSTSFSPGNAGRDANLRTAADKINDAVVYPDEIFSTNDAFGAMTYDNGYRMAPVIVDGKLEDGMGGGICQVSSTLYNALLFSELEIVERKNHSLKVGYADYGFDATLVEGAIDLKFKNDTGYPVFIESFIEERRVVVNIYGHEVHSTGRSLKFINELAEVVSPAETTVIEADTMPEGETEVVTAAKNGYRYNVYKLIYEDGKEIGRELVDRSYYRPVRGVTRVGTMPVSEFSGQEIYDPAQYTGADLIGPYQAPGSETPETNREPAPEMPEEYREPEPVTPEPYREPAPETPEAYREPEAPEAYREPETPEAYRTNEPEVYREPESEIPEAYRISVTD